jgi:hypothetical protein
VQLCVLTECISEFRQAGGDDTFLAATHVSPEWLKCIALSNEMYLLASKINPAFFVEERAGWQCG